MTEPSTEAEFDNIADQILGGASSSSGDPNPPKAFQPVSDWVSPVEKQRRRKALILPTQKSLDEFANRIASALRWPEPPAEVDRLATEARSKIAVARSVIVEAGSTANRHYASSPEAANQARTAYAEASMAVGAVEQAATDLFGEWVDGICSKVPQTHETALEALQEAAKAYRAHVRLTGAAQAMLEAYDAPLAYERYRPGGAKARQQINAPLQGIEEGIGFLNGTDYESGLYLAEGSQGRPSQEALDHIRRDAYSAVFPDQRAKFDRLFIALDEPLPRAERRMPSRSMSGPSLTHDDIVDVARLVGVDTGPAVIVTSPEWAEDGYDDEEDDQ